MLKRWSYVLAFICFVTLSVSFVSRKSLPKGKAPVKTLIIDPGHGGSYSGARGLFSYEKDVSLKVALKFGKAVQQAYPDVKVIFTRTTDANAGNKTNLKDDLHYRADLANSSGGDLFMSIHCNATGHRAGGWYEKVVTGKTPYTKTVGKGKKKRKVKAYKYTYENVWRENTVHGTESYIWALNKNDAKVSAVGMNTGYFGEIDSTGVMSMELPDPSDPAEKVRMLVYGKFYFKKSKELADLVEKEFSGRGRISRGVKQRNDEGIWVLQATGMPSILVEIGFISNKEEEEYINSDRGQEEIVDDLVNAFGAYKKAADSRSEATQ